jgi:hypothetical protein
MPIFLVDVQTAGALPVAFQHALLRMAVDVKSEPVTPARALQLLRSRVAPLLPNEHRTLLDSQGQPSWERLRMLIAKIAFASGGGQDETLLAAATLVEIVVRYSTRPHREVPDSDFAEVSSFVRVCGYLLVPRGGPQRRLIEMGIGLHQFCQYCWLPALARGVCRFHSVASKQIALPGGRPFCGSMRLKTAQRLKEVFDEKVLSLASSEEMAFHQSGFALPFLLPPSGLRTWLEERRPRLSALIDPPGEQIDEGALPSLLAVLYGEQAGEVADSIGAAVHVLTPVTLRAEAWFAAWLERPTWGGARRIGSSDVDLPIARPQGQGRRRRDAKCKRR